jgi:hypothetical protein
MATPNDLVTNWKAWTLVVLASEPGDRETDGAGLTTDGDERADGLGSGAEVVQDAVISTPISRPAKRIFGGTGGNSSRPGDSSARRPPSGSVEMLRWVRVGGVDWRASTAARSGV